MPPPWWSPVRDVYKRQGEKSVFRNPMESQAHSIACVYQELSIVPVLSVTDNIFMGHPIKKPHSVLLDYDAMHKRAYEVLKSLGVDVDVKKPCNTFGMGVQQMVEIARAIVLDAEFLIMDEPTSSLGEKEVELLMKSIRLSLIHILISSRMFPGH